MMKALTSSCSKAMVETLGPFSPRVPLCVSDRPEFCFTLRSKNEKKGWNLLLLKLVRNNDLYPVHAVPPKDQVCFFFFSMLSFTFLFFFVGTIIILLFVLGLLGVFLVCMLGTWLLSSGGDSCWVLKICFFFFSCFFSSFLFLKFRVS